ncbi:MAG: HAMP domain-containing histidine kinase [Gorillibacterium sp.]|nr:HAMP domain-containing histidine kinase [Gorillibacterium sp.]
MKSLYYRVCLLTLVTVFVSSLFAFLLSNVYYHVKLKPFNDAKLTKMVGNLQQFSELHPEWAESYLKSSAALGYEIYLVDDQGDERFFGNPFREKDLSKADITQVLAGEPYHGVANFPNKPFITGFFDNRLSNTVGIPLQINDHQYALFLRPDTPLQFGELRIFFAMIMLLTVLFSILIFIHICAIYLIKPIHRLTEATKRIAKGRYDIELPLKRTDEIGQLAVHFTTMSHEVERAERVRQEFVANVSHEIQSPLASIQGFATALKQDTLPPHERIHYLSIIEQESRRLSLLSKQLLTLSSLDQTPHALLKKSFSLRAQLRQVVQVMTWGLTEKELSLRLELPEIFIYGNEVLLYQVWMNLVANAVKYTPAGRSITIQARIEGARCKVYVTDTGDGIVETELPFLFDRFYRGDRARDRTAGSSGLGLSIVQKIVHLHEGTVEVTSTLGEGTTFIVSLPHS